MRFEVLTLLYQASEGKEDAERNAWAFAVDLGIWHAELFRIVEWLASHGLMRYCGAGPIVCLTRRGVDFLERPGERRQSIRESDL